MFVSEQVAKRLLSLAPNALSLPMKVVPFALKAKIIARLLSLSVSRQFNPQELSFLRNRPVGVTVRDLDLNFVVTYHGDFTIQQSGDADVFFSANSRELLLILAAKEDPDTLFFQQKLSMQGNTEYGLAVKNLLMSLELDSQPMALKQGILALTAVLLSLEAQAGIEHAYL